jgi:cytochrome c oxidase subunit 2
VFWFITAVCVFFTLLIAVLLMFFAIRYRRKSDDYFPTPLIGSKKLEIFWTVVPLALALVMFFWGASVYLDLNRPPANALEVYVTGRQWMWHLQHPGGQSEINTLHVPVGRPVKLILTSEDVIHDFSIPAFRVKYDAVPGRYTYLWFEATKPGTYHFFCAQYCGTDHSRMIGKVVALEPQQYEQWLARGSYRSLAFEGSQLFQQFSCNDCHNPAAGNKAPALHGLFGRRVPLEGGGSQLADETYLSESILVPGRKVRAGWRNIMYPYEGQINDKQMVRLLAFIKGLRDERDYPPLLNDRDRTRGRDEGKGDDPGKGKKGK